MLEDDIWTRETVDKTIGYAKRKQWCGVQRARGTAVIERCVTTFGAVQQHSFEDLENRRSLGRKDEGNVKGVIRYAIDESGTPAFYESEVQGWAIVLR